MALRASIGAAAAVLLTGAATAQTPKAAPQPPLVYVNPPLNPNAATPPPDAQVTPDGAVIAPPDVNGKLTPAQVEEARRAAAAKAKDGVIRSAPPAIAVDGQDNGGIVSGATIR